MHTREPAALHACSRNKYKLSMRDLALDEIEDARSPRGGLRVPRPTFRKRPLSNTGLRLRRCRPAIIVTVFKLGFDIETQVSPFGQTLVSLCSASEDAVGKLQQRANARIDVRHFGRPPELIHVINNSRAAIFARIFNRWEPEQVH
jgi:hypothetical protein